MKKIYLASILMFISIFVSQGQILNEGFESGIFPPTGWSEDSISGSVGWDTLAGNSNGSVASAHSGALNAILVDNSGAADTSRLITPQLDLSGAGAYNLSFWYSQVDWSGDQDELHVYYKNSAGGTWSLLASYTNNITSWTEEIISLPNLSNDYYIAFDGVARYGYGVTLDDIVVDLPPSCPTPNALGLTSLSSSSANLGWTENGSANNWEIEWDTAGFTMGTGNFVMTNTNPYNLTGLTIGTSYQYYVRSICGAGDTSAWAGPLTFTTSLDYCGGDLFVDSGDTAGDYSNDENITTIICPDNAGDLVTVSFNSFNTESGYDYLYIYNGSGTTGTLLGTFDGTTLPPDFTSTDASGCLTFLFTSDGSATEPGWDATITCNSPATCPQPSSLTTSNVLLGSADLGWTENGTSTDWIVEYGPAGFTLGTGTTVNTSINPLAITGLNSGTDYDFYVQADCGGGDLSAVVGPSAFTTTPDYCAGDHFYDTGGAAGQYGNNENTTTTICGSSSSEAVTVSFVSFNTESGYDSLHIYNGNTATNWLGSYSDTLLPPDYTSTDASGCLTFVFVSDGSATRDGWDATITCGNPNCPTPDSLVVNSISGTTANLSWMETGSATSWEIVYGPAGFTLGSGSTMATTTNPTSIGGLTVGTAYDFYVRSLCGGSDTSSFSNKASGSTSTDGIETVLNYKVKVYPNPSNGVVNIEFETLTNSNTVEFISVTGEILKSISINTKSTSIDVSDLASGLYTLRIQNDNGIGYKKIIME